MKVSEAVTQPKAPPTAQPKVAEIDPQIRQRVLADEKRKRDREVNDRFTVYDQIAKEQRKLAKELQDLLIRSQRFLRDNESEIPFGAVAKVRLRIRSIQAAMQSLMRGGLTTDLSEAELRVSNASVQRIIVPKPNSPKLPSNPGLFRLGGFGNRRQ